MKNNSFFRPKWTCGKYNEEHHAAILYNLIEGFCFYFEDDSADVIGALLAFARNENIDLEKVSKDTNTAMESLLEFMTTLINYGLITQYIPNNETILEYRKNIKSQIKIRLEQEHKDFLDMTVLGKTSNAERMYAERVGTVTSVMFELTYKCSEKCIHCYNPGATRNNDEVSERGNRREMDFNDYKHIIDNLIEQGMVKVCLSGGDPFSKPHVWDIVKYLYDNEIAFDIFTNGINAYKDVERLASFFPRLIGVSLYSGVESVHDLITRTRGSYARTISFIKSCHEYGLAMNIKCCVMKPNFNSYYTVKDIANENGALAQFDINITDSVEGDICASQNLRMTEEMLEVVLRDPDLPYYISSNPIELDDVIDKNGVMCSAGISSLCITPEGNVQPCCAFPMRLGNIFEDSVTKILKTSKSLKWWKAQTLNDCTDCHKHPYCKFCQLCAGNNYIANGTPLRPSNNNCQIAKVRYNLSLKMADGNYDPLQGKTLQDRLSEFTVDLPFLSRQRILQNFRDKRVNEVPQTTSITFYT